MMVAGVSAGLRAASVLLGVGGGFAAVYLAKVIPMKMGVSDRPRSDGWWATAVLVGGVFGWLTASSFGWALLPAIAVFGSATLALTLIDQDHQLIPNRVLFPAMGIAAVLLVVGSIADGDGRQLIQAGIGAVAYFAVLLIVALIARGGFGMGDVKLALLLGLFLGYRGRDSLAVGFMLAILLGGVASILVLIFTRKGKGSKFAYGPYLVLGSWIALFWGSTIADWYLRRG
ncbi:MAG: prepilin peptidase [bacterium]|nr:prepilin peptidase [bacterium]